MKLANPLNYPIAVLVGAIALVAGARVAKLPPVVMIPVAAMIATGGAIALKARAPERFNLGNPALERELQAVQQQAQALATKANELRSEASRLMTEANQMELLVAVQYACDRASELPAKVTHLAQRLQGGDSLLSVQELQQQLNAATARRNASQGIARRQLDKLIDSLQQNLTLARQGQDARQAQVISLSTLISDSAGVLQQMQNQLRTANLQDTQQSLELRSLSDDLKLFQENVDLLVSD
jgi:chromosome segregation ATPase